MEFAARGSKADIETGSAFMPKFGSDGLIPVVATDEATGQVLMFAFMNAEALELTLKTGEAHYWSRSRNELWHKGGTSGHVQLVKSMRTDCDQDTLWLTIEQIGPGACHVGYKSCFYRHLVKNPDGSWGLEIDSTRSYDPSSVYSKD